MNLVAMHKLWIQGKAYQLSDTQFVEMNADVQQGKLSDNQESLAKAWLDAQGIEPMEVATEDTVTVRPESESEPETTQQPAKRRRR